MIKLDSTDKTILNRIQSNFPISPRPYQDIARELNLSEDEVIEKVRHLKEGGVIRRIGGNFVPGKLGFVSTLCAGHVPEDRIAHFTSVVNTYPGVTHNYLRDNHYNIWFTVIAPSEEIIDQYLSEISKKTGVTVILNLPATKVYKIRAHFDL
jgi:DNA-binding Lrp family transcriptional regulator